MKKLLLSFMLLAAILPGCKQTSDDSDMVAEAVAKSSSTALAHAPTKIYLSADKATKEKLYLKDNKGQVARAIEFVSEVNAGDTIYWAVNEKSFVKSIEEIIIVRTSDCKNPFPQGFVFNATKTLCYGVLNANATGSIKYDIKYKCNDGKVIIEDPKVVIKPPTISN